MGSFGTAIQGEVGMVAEAQLDAVDGKALGHLAKNVQGKVPHFCKGKVQRLR